MIKQYLPLNTAYLPPQAQASSEPNNGFSLEDILEQDNNKLLDKVVNTALSITYRLKIYNDTQKALTEKWNELSFEISRHYYEQYSKSNASKERNQIEKMMLEQKHLAWKDLNEPTNYFVELFHKRQETKMDKKILK